jgi:hypothetical protein
VIEGKRLDNGSLVTIGGSECTQVTLLLSPRSDGGQDVLRCVLPAGVGKGVATVIKNSFGQTGSIAALSYALPSVDTIDGCAGVLSNGDAAGCPTTGGVQLVLSGRNFGRAGATVMVGSNECTDVEHASGGRGVTCTLPTGVGANQSVVVNQAGMEGGAIETQKRLSYAIPRVIKISGCADVGNSTTGCLTIGNEVLTISGEHFGTAAAVRSASLTAVVRIWHGTEVSSSDPSGFTTCWPTTLTDDRLECLLPAGSGLDLRTEVVIAGQSSGSRMGSRISAPTISYAPPQITGVWGCGSSKIPMNVTTGCNTSGSQLVTFRGSNLGPAWPSAYSIMVGTAALERACVVKAMTVAHSTVECQLATGGIGAKLPVKVKVARSSSPAGSFYSYSHVLLSYSPPVVRSVFPPTGPNEGLKPLDIYGDGFGSHAVSAGLVHAKVGSRNCTGLQQISNQHIRCTLPPFQFGSRNETDDGSRSIQIFAAGQASDPEAAFTYDGCPGGRFWDGDACAKCKAGRFQNVPFASGCTVCNVTEYSSVGAALCASCAAGRYGNETELVECTNCAPGYFSGNGSAVCSACGASKYSGEAAQMCTDCAVGKYQEAFGAIECKDCPHGKYSGESSSKCTLCGSGRYSNESGADQCSDCPAGKYGQMKGLYACNYCEAGEYSGGKATSCTGCSAGKFSGNGSSSCTSCPKSYYQSNSSASGCWVCPLESTRTEVDGVVDPLDCTCAPGYFAAGPHMLAADGKPVPCSKCPRGASCLGGVAMPKARVG